MSLPLITAKATRSMPGHYEKGTYGAKKKRPAAKKKGAKREMPAGMRKGGMKKK